MIHSKQLLEVSRKVYCFKYNIAQNPLLPAALPHIHILQYSSVGTGKKRISIIHLVLLLGHINIDIFHLEPLLLVREMNSTSNFQQNTIEAAELLLLGGGGGEEELLFPSDFYYNDNNFMITESIPPPNTFIHDDQNLSFLQQEFDHNDDFYTINNLIFPSSTYNSTPSSTSSSENFPLLDPNDYNFNSYSSNNYPKRQKISYNHSIMNNPCSDFGQYSCLDYGFYTPNPPPLPSLPQFLPELNFLHSKINEAAAAAPMLPVLPYFSGESVNKKSNNDGCLSAQSVAARQRRRKITEKTQLLGKLIPGVGNNKLNTAEMFQAAFKYVKFLQAQVGILELMQPQQGNNKDSSLMSMDMGGLLTSLTVQEKLYSLEKCLVPNEFVQVLAKDEELKQSQPLISKDLDSLLVVHHQLENRTTF